MRNFFITAIILLATYSANSQDIIYSYYYPQGIVTKSLTEHSRFYELTPIENGGLTIKISKKSTRKIIYQNGTNFTNPSPVDYTDETVLPTDSLTGKILYRGIVEIDGAKKKSLFDIAKTIPQGEISYELQASDETDFTFVKYLCHFPLKFAGDPYVLTCNLLIKFKDGKLKYEYSDFTAFFELSKTKKAYDWSGGLNTVKKGRTMILDKMYAGLGRSDTKKFWAPIPIRINESISSIKKKCADLSKNGDNW